MCFAANVEAEFRAYHLLSLIGQHGKFKGDQQAFISMLQACNSRFLADGLIWHDVFWLLCA